MNIHINELTISGFNGRPILSIDDFHIKGKKSVGILGPSGSGKSTLLNYLCGACDLLPLEAAGFLTIDDVRVDDLSREDRRHFLSRVFSRVFPEPSYSLNFGCTIQKNAQMLLTAQEAGVCSVPAEVSGADVSDPAMSGTNVSGKSEFDAFIRLLAQGRIDYHSVQKKYPRQLSGGERQWTALSIALARKNRILLLDEPTVSLEPGKLTQLIECIHAEKREFIVVTHDREFLDRMNVQTVYTIEEGEMCPQEQTHKKKHTSCGVPELKMFDVSKSSSGEQPVKPHHPAPKAPYIQTVNLSQSYLSQNRFFPKRKTVFENLSWSVTEDTVLFVEGANGSGKTTLYKSLLRILDDTDGKILVRFFNSGTVDLTALNTHGAVRDTAEMRALRPRLQWVEQESMSTFDPSSSFASFFRQTARGLNIPVSVYMAAAEKLLSVFQLDVSILQKKSALVSSGERKRLDIIRALASHPEILILDEPYNHLDMKNISLLISYLNDCASDGVSHRLKVLIVSTHILKETLKGALHLSLDGRSNAPSDVQ